MFRRLVGTFLGLILVAPGFASEPAARAERLQAWRAALARASALEDSAAAAVIYRGILEDAERLDEQGLLVARAADALADLHREQGRFDRAAVLYERSTLQWARLLGAQQPRLAVSYHNLGVCYVELARWDAAERVLNAARAIWTRHGRGTELEQTEKALRAARERRRIPRTAAAPPTPPG